MTEKKRDINQLSTIKKVVPGVQKFEELIVNHYFYVDKTHFIKEWWEAGHNTTLITRPRRFGKTLTMSMLECFFSIKYAGRVDLFKNLYIWKDTRYQQLQGTYPVINLSFSGVKGNNFDKVRADICELITELYDNYPFISEGITLTEGDKEYFRRVSKNMDDTDATLSLRKLSKILYQYYHKPVIILLDEYDTPMQEAYTYGYWKEIVEFMGSLFNFTFKSNPYLERGIMTGITRVSKESVFSDLNNLEVVTTTSDKYSTVFGFTEEEVFKALDEYNMAQEKEKVKIWYDGFTFGEQKDIYNPWSILHFLEKRKIFPYWSNTSSNALVERLIQKSDKKIKMSFEQLLKGKTIKEQIDEQIIFNQLDNKKSSIWSLLLASGYLKVVNCEKQITFGRKPIYELAITNGETMDMFFDMVLSWFTEYDDYNEFVKELFNSNVKKMNKFMNEIALKTFSCFDVGNQPSKVEPERFYHGFVLGLLVDLREEYIVISNRESGFGRYDVMIEPKDKSKNAYILEFKVLDSDEEKTLEDTVQSALKQIEEKQYKTLLVERGCINIYSYGFAFRGKKVLNVEQDKALLANAQQRAQKLLEDYVNNIGKSMGKQYEIVWVYLDDNKKE